MPFSTSEELKNFYSSGLSMSDIAKRYQVSIHKVTYWMDKYYIKRRSHSEATYIKHNPNGDPFVFKMPSTLDEAKLFGLGLGLYWGEGNKKNPTSVRLCNSDPELIKIFIAFLVNIFGVNKNDLRFWLLIFDYTDEDEALQHWISKLGIKRGQFSKTTIAKTKSIGTYRQKNMFGVLSVYYYNKKLRDLLISLLEKSQT